jgi:hypothetical protein
MNEINQILMPMLTQFLFVTGFLLLLFSFVIGVLLLLRPSVVMRLNQWASALFSLRRSTKALEMPRYVDRAFYNHHKILGCIVTLTSAYVLYYFSMVYDTSIITGSMAHDGYNYVYAVLYDAIRIIMLLTGVSSLVIGVIVFIRPSRLKSIESWSNRWVSTRRASRSLVEEKDQINQLAYKNPRLVGIIFVCLSIYAAVGLFLIYIN